MKKCYQYLEIENKKINFGDLGYLWCNQHSRDGKRKWILGGQDIGGAINIWKRENQNDLGRSGVAHLSMRNARNTMCTRGTPEWHLGLVALLVKGPK